MTSVRRLRREAARLGCGLAVGDLCGYRLPPAGFPLDGPHQSLRPFSAGQLYQRGGVTVTRPCRTASLNAERNVARTRCRVAIDAAALHLLVSMLGAEVVEPAGSESHR